MNEHNEFDMIENEETVKELLQKSVKLQSRLCKIGCCIIFLLFVLAVLIYITAW